MLLKDKKFLFFTGIDRCGKSTTRKLFATTSDEKHFTFDRSFIDNFVFDKIYRNVEFTNKEIITFLKKFSKLGKIYIVYLLVDFCEINKRSLKTENVEYKVEELQKTQKLYFEFFKLAKKQNINVIMINANNKTPEQIVKEIMKVVK